MNNASRFIVILFGLCAVVWTVRAVLDIVYQTYTNSIALFALNIICAVIWIAAFFIKLRNYRSK